LARSASCLLRIHLAFSLQPMCARASHAMSIRELTSA
jgi:hypothetical protein